MIAWELLWVGAFFLAAMTFLFPILSLIVSSLLARRPLGEPNWPPRTLEILIPAHNEEKWIAVTLSKLRTQMDSCSSRFPDTQVSVRVGADACNDDTVARARAVAGVIVEEHDFRSKWKTLGALTRSSHADWVAFVDAEITWPDGLLAELLGARWSGKLCGIAPAFGGGLVWKVERALKSIEGLSGGPVSVHGATILYPLPELREALRDLKAHDWINDDVAIPLTMRTLFPSATLAYFRPSVAGGESVRELSREVRTGVFKSQLRKRRRMVVGNLQWIRELLPRAARRDPLTAHVALRRVFRVFWAYGALSFVAGATMLWPMVWVVAVVIVCFDLALKQGALSSAVLAAFWASLRAPWDLLSLGKAEWR